MFNYPALNTFDSDYKDKLLENKTAKPHGAKKLKTIALKSLYEKYCQNTVVDFMNIYCE
jgi:hypothetical protein